MSFTHCRSTCNVLSISFKKHQINYNDQPLLVLLSDAPEFHAPKMEIPRSESANSMLEKVTFALNSCSK